MRRLAAPLLLLSKVPGYDLPTDAANSATRRAAITGRGPGAVTLGPIDELRGDASAAASVAHDISRCGIVVGSGRRRVDGRPVAAMWGSDGAMVALPAPRGSGYGALARRVSGNGAYVAGYAFAAARLQAARAVRWHEGTPVDLGHLGGGSSWALAVNDAGHAVGWSMDPSGHRRPFVWSDGVMSDLGVAPGCSAEAWDITDDGVVVGHYHAAGGPRAFTWHEGEWSDLPAPVGVVYSHAVAINNAGQIVGSAGTLAGGVADAPPGPYAVLWDSGSARLLATMPHDLCAAEATDINDRGVIVGRGIVVGTGCPPGRPHLVGVFQVGGEATLVPLPPRTSALVPTAINDAGRAVGCGTVNGVARAFAWDVTVAPPDAPSGANQGGADPNDMSALGAGRDAAQPVA